MAAIITEKFRTHNAKQFIEDFSESGQSNYIFIGRSHAWTDDTSPPAPANSQSEEIGAYEDMIALKKVSSTDISHGLVRYDWTSGTKYDEYRDNYSSSNTTNVTGVSNFFDGRGYVITDEFKVYKCLKTGMSGGSTVASTVKPTSVDTANPQVTGDGYMWKFMYSVVASDVIKFVTNDFIPVKSIGAKSAVAGSGTNGGFGSTASDDGSAQWDVENAAVDGAIYHYVVTAAGSGYSNGSSGSFTLDVAVEGDGSGAVATLTFASGSLSSVAFKDTSSYGSGYKRASFPTLNSAISGISAGSGATIHPVISPINGHGADPIEELGGNYAIVNSRLEFGEGSGDFPTDNDFRRIGLIKNPVQSSDGTISSASSMTATNQLTVADASSISVDDLLTDAASESATTAKVRVVSKTGNVLKTLPVVNAGGEYVAFANSDEVFRNGAGTKSTDVTGSGVSASHPEMTRFTGQILYVENRGAVSRAADQIEDIKLIIEM
tara:strand:- start:2190 stop:3665 length:1476 start_codon:yes stop_codon:yes gene_type:complete